jgi:autophagy-related protein 5
MSSANNDGSDDDGASRRSGGVGVGAPASITSIQNANWQGMIPIQLSIAPTSLSSTNKPRPLHRMVSRMTYLHLGLFDEIMHLHEYAPTSSYGGSSSKQMMVVREEPPDSPKQEEQNSNEHENNNRDANNQQEVGTDEQQNTSQNNNISSNNTEQRNATLFPQCWFEDEESGVPLRWQLFVGVLYDLMKGRQVVINHPGSPSSACNQFRNLPWKIRIHFTSYPTDQLLPLDIVPQQQQQQQQNASQNSNESLSSASAATTNSNDKASQEAQINTLIGRIFRNSLKQALFLQYGSSKVAMSITKNSHEKIWDAIVQSSYDAYNQVNTDIQIGLKSPPINNKLSLTEDLTDENATTAKSSLPQLVPVRILLNDKPAIQRPIVAQKKDISEYLKQKPTEILKDDADIYVSPYTTLGDVLLTCLPSLFKQVDSSAVVDSRNIVVSDASSTHYSIQGVQPSLSCVVVDLWRSLCHPDHFLYVIVVTQ